MNKCKAERVQCYPSTESKRVDCYLQARVCVVPSCNCLIHCKYCHCFAGLGFLVWSSLWSVGELFERRRVVWLAGRGSRPCRCGLRCRTPSNPSCYLFREGDCCRIRRLSFILRRFLSVALSITFVFCIISCLVIVC